MGTFPYEGEGWGLTTDGRALILSDGSNQLRFLDPGTFAVQRVADAGHVMPQKSTDFYPKVLSGLWMYEM